MTGINQNETVRLLKAALLFTSGRLDCAEGKEPTTDLEDYLLGYRYQKNKHINTDLLDKIQ